MNPSFTVVVTVYNLGSYLEDCLSSIKLASNGYNVEVIVVDDGSSDMNTLKVLEITQASYSTFKYLSKKNGGPASARNYGVKYSSGEFIVPFDADNIMRPCFFSSLSKSLNHNSGQYDVFHFNALFFGLKNLVWPDSDFCPQDISVENRVDACTCIRRSALLEVGGFDEILIIKGFEDWELWVRMLSSGKKFHFIDEILYDYRVREQSTLAVSWEKRNEAISHIFNKPENRLMSVIRNLSLANHDLKKPLSFNQILNLMIKRLNSKIFHGH